MTQPTQPATGGNQPPQYRVPSPPRGYQLTREQHYRAAENILAAHDKLAKAVPPSSPLAAHNSQALLSQALIHATLATAPVDPHVIPGSPGPWVPADLPESDL